MKKIIILLGLGLMLFASSNADIEKKLDLILNKLDKIEQKLSIKDMKIKQLQKELKEQKIKTSKQFALKNCKNLKVVSYDYEYHNEILPYYTIKVTLKNFYPYTVTYINGNIFFDDKDGTTILKQFVKRDVKLKSKGKITLYFNHMIGNELEKDLKDEKKSDLNVYFSATDLRFANNQHLECF